MADDNLISDYQPPFYPDAIPPELKAIDRWAYWFVEIDAGGRLSKRPRHSTAKPEDWGPFERDLASCREGSRRGLGFCCTGHHDIVHIDIDGCIDEEGALHPVAASIVRRLPGYWETSPSGRGLRGAVMCTLGWDMTVHKSATAAGIGLEFYNGRSPRYLTYTGDEYFLSDGAVLPADPAVFEEIREEFNGARAESSRGVESEMPEVLPEADLPCLDGLPLSETARGLLLWGDEGEDGSRTLHETVISLVGCGLDKQTVMSMIYHNSMAWEIASRHRKYNDERALAYLWKHHIGPAEVKAPKVVDDADLDDLIEERADVTREANGAGSPPISLSEAVDRLVYVRSIKSVFDRLKPNGVLKLDHAETAFASSGMFHTGPGEKNPRWKPVIRVWVADERRVEVDVVTYRPDAPVITTCPHGSPAANTWTPYDRGGEGGDPSPFIEHVQWLFGHRAEEFLDWLAHIEQQPGKLPHTSWLHISPMTGTGRNWLSSLLSRVWVGRVAGDLELTKVLNATYNARLAQAQLAVVNEIREGGNPWHQMEQFKALVNPEYREINRKFGYQSVEFNVCRWLIFSNHIAAMPLDDVDRRVEVVRLDEDPKDPEYYQGLYHLLDDRAFVLGVAQRLAARDISRFNPGRHALKDEARNSVVDAGKNTLDWDIEELIAEWPSDVIFASDLVAYLGVDKLDRHVAMSLTSKRAASIKRRVRVDGCFERMWALRNVGTWLSSVSAREEAIRGREKYNVKGLIDA